MTPEEALELIDNVVATVSLTRQQHARLVEAVTVLLAAITPSPEETPDDDTNAPKEGASKR